MCLCVGFWTSVQMFKEPTESSATRVTSKLWTAQCGRWEGSPLDLELWMCVTTMSCLGTTPKSSKQKENPGNILQRLNCVLFLTPTLTPSAGAGIQAQIVLYLMYLFFKFNVYGYFACLYVCALYVYLAPIEARRGIGSLGAGVIDRCEPQCGC